MFKVTRLACGSEDVTQYNTKDKKSEVFSYFKKGKGKFLARSHTIFLSKGF